MDSDKPETMKLAQEAVTELVAVEWEEDGYEVGGVAIHVLINTPDGHKDQFVYTSSIAPNADGLPLRDRERLAESLVRTANSLLPEGAEVQSA